MRASVAMAPNSVQNLQEELKLHGCYDGDQSARRRWQAKRAKGGAACITRRSALHCRQRVILKQRHDLLNNLVRK